jgi:outer membrane protein assembly factor BamB
MLKRTLLLAFPLALVGLTMCGTGSNPVSSGADSGSDAASSSGSAGSSGGSSGSGGGSSGSGGSSGVSGSSSGGVDAGPAVGASVLTYHNHINRDGFFIDSKLTATTAAAFARDTTFSGTLNGNVYASPLYVDNGVGGKGTFYVATESNNLYALDETTGELVWPKAANFGTPANQSGVGCGGISPIGITGTPAIDLATRLIVFDAATSDNNGNIKAHTIYGVSIDDGSTKWSVDVSTLKDSGGLQFLPPAQNQRSAVLIVNGIAYVPYGGHAGDCGNYHGWVVGVPLNGQGAKAWATQVQGAGIWAPGGAASDGQSIFVATGNGFDQNATWAQSEGIFRLDPGPSFTGQTADYFAPNNWQTLDKGDFDIGGSGPLVIDAPSITPSKLVMAEGKDGYLYLIDRTNLGGITSAPQTANVGALPASTTAIINGSAFATVGGTTYVVFRPYGNVPCPGGSGSGALVTVKLDPAVANKMTVAWCADPQGAGSPIITTSNGTNDPLVWLAGGDLNDETNQLHAFDLLTGKVVFAGGGSSDTFTTTVHRFATVAAVHGRIFVTGDGTLYAFK